MTNLSKLFDSVSVKGRVDGVDLKITTKTLPTSMSFAAVRDTVSKATDLTVVGTINRGTAQEATFRGKDKKGTDVVQYVPEEASPKGKNGKGD